MNSRSKWLAAGIATTILLAGLTAFLVETQLVVMSKPLSGLLIPATALQQQHFQQLL
jgi:hypothetical protein